MDSWDFLQVNCAMYINSDVPGLSQANQPNTKPLRRAAAPMISPVFSLFPKWGVLMWQIRFVIEHQVLPLLTSDDHIFCWSFVKCKGASHGCRDGEVQKSRDPDTVLMQWCLGSAGVLCSG